MTCSEENCKNKISWIRHTQFAGSHPFCDSHAKLEKDFKKSSSYLFWEKINSIKKD